MATSVDLFGDDVRLMQTPVVKKSAADLSKAQKLFNRLTQKIGKQRQALLEWQNTIPLLRQKHQEELQPNLESYNQQRVVLLKLFDRAFEQKSFSKMEKTKLADLIEQISAELLMAIDDPEVKAIHDRYSAVDFDDVAAQEQQMMQAMVKEMLDIDVGDEVNFRSPEELMRKIHEQMQQKFEEEEQQAADQPPQRKKSAKTLAKEAKEKQEADNVSQSLREVYRKLASALHPDKEQDLRERERKTLLMQRVNVAYDAKDLLALLSLQLEAEQITPENISALSDNRLKHYNQLLKEQLEDLEHEIEAMMTGFIMRFQMNPEQQYTPKSALFFIDQEIRGLKTKLRHIKQDVAAFGQMKNLKAWLKGYQIQRYDQFDEEEDDGEAIMQAMQGMFATMRT